MAKKRMVDEDLELFDESMKVDGELAERPRTAKPDLKTRLLTEVKQVDAGYFDIDELVRFIEREKQASKDLVLDDISESLSAMLYRLEHRND